MSELDHGLLSPVRAGTPIEALTGDEAWLQAMLDAEAALARAQCALGAVPESAAAAISRAAVAENFDTRAIALAARETANPVVALVAALTRRVAESDPAAAEYVHRGSTSQDVLDTGAMLLARRALAVILDDLAEAADALAGLAERYRDTAVAGRTLALQAVPTTLGLRVAGWRQLILDAHERLARVRDGLPVSIGGAAGTLAGYLEYAHHDADDPGAAGGEADYADRLVERFARETGLCVQVLPWHALRTPMADLAAALAHGAGALGKLALDVQTLSRTEIGELAEPGGAAHGVSSAMPHKRNPVLSTLIRSAALQVPPLALGLTQCLLAEDERSAGAWHAEWLLLRECLRLTGGAAHTAVELTRGLRARPERIEANLRLIGEQLATERVAARLAPQLGRIPAKRLLGEAVRLSADRGLSLPDALAELLERQTATPRPEIPERLWDPAAYIGAAPELVDRALRKKTPPRTGDTP